jgi:membrane protease YdiL (CAAX protease family)
MAFFWKVDSFPRVRSLGKIFLYALFVLLGGALVAPQAWKLMQLLPPDLLHGLIGDVQRMPFHRYLSRSIQVAAIVLLPPLLLSLHVRSLEELGLYGNERRFKDLLAGLASGIPAALVLIIAIFLSGALEFHANWKPSVLPRIAVSAVVVAVLEEFLFRGVILGFLRQSLSRWMAIVCSALIFAGLHFLNLPSSGNEKVAPTAWSGLTALASLREGLPSWPIFGWAFATLLLAGIILAWMTTRTGSLWAAIGLHGSWVFTQQFFNSIAGFRHLPAGALLPYVGPAQCHGAVPIGLDALASLLLAALIAVLLLRNRPSSRLYTRITW